MLELRRERNTRSVRGRDEERRIEENKRLGLRASNRSMRISSANFSFRKEALGRHAMLHFGGWSGSRAKV